MAPTRLERLVGDVFADFMDCEAVHLGGPGDGGIDLILLDGERRFVVQVKRRADPDSTESVKGIREFVGAMVLDGSVRGLYVTTARRFSGPAVEAASTAQSRGPIEYLALANAEVLMDVCRLTTRMLTAPWKTALIDDPAILSIADSGFQHFMEIAMGDPKWRYDKSSRPARKP